MTQTRQATHAILGFLYQFNKTLLEILEANDTQEIVIEGPIEDIDTRNSDGSITAIQCKYHSGKDKLVPSDIFKPLVEMMLHYSENSTIECKYIIFAYYPKETIGKRAVTIEELNAALDSKLNKKSYKDKVGKILSTINDYSSIFADRSDFVQKFAERCNIEFGQSIEDLQDKVLQAFTITDLPDDSISALYFPNAIYEISQISTMVNEKDRTIKRSEFISKLATVRKTFITQLTLALKTKKAILRARYNQLKQHLSQNSRERTFFISANQLQDFDVGIVKFIKSFLDKYHYKPTHQHLPTFVLDCELAFFNQVCNSLFTKGIKFNEGIVGGVFKKEKFLEPVIPLKAKPLEANYRLRLCCTAHTRDILLHMSHDDLFLVSEKPDIKLPSELEVDIELVSVSNFDELKYVLGLVNEIPIQ